MLRLFIDLRRTYMIADCSNSCCICLIHDLGIVSDDEQQLEWSIKSMRNIAVIIIITILSVVVDKDVLYLNMLLLLLIANRKIYDKKQQLEQQRERCHCTYNITDKRLLQCAFIVIFD